MIETCPFCDGPLEKDLKYHNKHGIIRLLCHDCKKGFINCENYINDSTIAKGNTHNADLTAYHQNDNGPSEV